MTFQKTVNYQYASGLPGELAADGPLRADSFRLVTNIAQTATLGIGFGLAFSLANTVNAGAAYASDIGNPDNLAYTSIAVPGAGATTDTFAGILISPKEHALVGTSGNPLAATYQLPNGSWGELCRMGILWAAVTSGATAGFGQRGNRLCYSIVDGTLQCFAGADTALPANCIAIPGAQLLSNIGVSQTQVLAKIELTGIGALSGS